MRTFLFIFLALIFISCGDSKKKQENTDIKPVDTVKKEKQDTIIKQSDKKYDSTDIEKQMEEINSLNVKKPAVYLYPEKTTEIQVKLTINGYLTKTEPFYDNEWNVIARPDGLIDNKYDYLFYEADLKKIELPDEGWIVEYNKLEKWFDESLPNLGLNTKEKRQFKDYWLKNLKYSNYYEIKLLDNNFLNDNMKLIIVPEPQTIIRFIFYFTPVNEKIFLKEPTITKKERKGFTVVEWGGINKGKKTIIP
jgi:hypothetical protein